MDLSNRYKSKYYKDKSNFNSVLITIGIIIMVLLGGCWLFVNGIYKVGDIIDGNEHSRLLSVWMDKTNVKYTKIQYKGFLRTVNEKEEENEYSFEVKGYQDSSMTVPLASTEVKATFVENFSRQPKYMTSLYVRR